MSNRLLSLHEITARFRRGENLFDITIEKWTGIRDSLDALEELSDLSPIIKSARTGGAFFLEFQAEGPSSAGSLLGIPSRVPALEGPSAWNSKKTASSAPWRNGARTHRAPIKPSSNSCTCTSGFNLLSGLCTFRTIVTSSYHFRLRFPSQNA